MPIAVRRTFRVASVLTEYIQLEEQTPDSVVRLVLPVLLDGTPDEAWITDLQNELEAIAPGVIDAHQVSFDGDEMKFRMVAEESVPRLVMSILPRAIRMVNERIDTFNCQVVYAMDRVFARIDSADKSALRLATKIAHKVDDMDRKVIEAGVMFNIPTLLGENTLTLMNSWGYSVELGEYPAAESRDDHVTLIVTRGSDVTEEDK